MSEKSDMPVGDIFHQPDRLVLHHPVYMSEFGDSFFAVYLVRQYRSFVPLKSRRTVAVSCKANGWKNLHRI
jgi:hypothetical protein